MSEESKMLPKSVEASPTLKVILPCLRSHSEDDQKREPRKVSFPEEDDDLVTGYLEPANAWEYGKPIHQFRCKYSIIVKSFLLACQQIYGVLI